MTIDEINEVLKFYTDRGLIKDRPSNKVLRKLISKHSAMKAPTGIDRLMEEVVKADAVGDIGRSMPLGKSAAKGRTPKTLKQLNNILGDFQDSLRAARVPKGMTSAEIAAILDPDALPTVVKNLSSTNTLPVPYRSAVPATIEEVLAKTASAAKAAPVEEAIAKSAIWKEGIPDVIAKSVDLPPIPTAVADDAVGEVAKSKGIKGVLGKLTSRMPKTLMGKTKLGAGLALAGLFAHGLLSDDDNEQMSDEVTNTASAPVAAPTTRTALTIDPMTALLMNELRAPSRNQSASELAQSLQGIANIANALGAESLGSRQALRDMFANAPAEIKSFKKR